jgi:hypothetical protein
MNQVPNASFAVKVKFRRWGKAVRIGLADCPYCHRSDVCISRPKSLLEEVAILALLRPVRCRDCIRRFYRPLFVATPLRPCAVVEVKKPVQQAGTSQNGQQCSAQRGPSGKLVAKFGARVVW